MNSDNQVNSGDKKFKILLIGAGMMAPPLVDYLNKFKDSHITIANEYLDMAQNIADRDPEHLHAVYLDIDDSSQLESMISDHDHVISFIPPFLHPIIARACLKVGRNMTTSSYNNPEIIAMEEEIKAKGLIFLNECGLDPGIDIMSTMKVVHEAEKAGHTVTSYESYCGGLPVPEQAQTTDPFLYKFSWNPGAAIKASRNQAIFRRNGEVVKVNEALKEVKKEEDWEGAMRVETYPNRDSLQFMESFGMKDCQTFVRGTIRYEGFCSIVSAYHDLGLSSDDPVPSEANTLKKILQSKIDATQVQKMNSDGQVICKLIKNVASSFKGQPSAEQIEFFVNLLERVDFKYLIKETTDADLADNKLHKFDEKSIIKVQKSILKSLDFLEFFDDENKVNVEKKTYLQILSEAMQGKLALGDQDRDLVIMRHEFRIHSPTENKNWKKTSTLIASGDSKASGGYSIMSKSVGFTCAIVTRLVIQNKIPQRGVLSPIYPEIYEPILEELKTNGIFMEESEELLPDFKVKNPNA